MQTLKSCPRILLQKLLITILIGVGCLLVGAAYFLFCRDMMFLFLSLAVFTGAIVKAVTLYFLIEQGKYEEIEGICIGISAKPMRRYRKIRIMDNSGIESSFLLAKQTHIKIGNRYRFYFKQTSRPIFGSEYLDASLAGDAFLGLEDLGEYDSDIKSAKEAEEHSQKQTD